MGKNYYRRRRSEESGEFLWLMSLSDLMILLFVFFVVMFSFAYKKVTKEDMQKIAYILKNKKAMRDPVEQVQQQINAWVEQEKMAENIVVQRTEDGVTIDIRDQVLFKSGAYIPHAKGMKIIQGLAPLLEKVPAPYKIGVEGHTDDTPIHTEDIQDNWDLSSKRALSVMYALNLSSKASQRTVLMAHAEMEPIAPNRKPTGQIIPQNQSKNRRVTLRVF